MFSKQPHQLAGPAGRQQELARVMDARKSLSVGNPYVQGQQGTGAAYVHEQLDDYIVELQESQKELKFFPKLYKQPCPGPVWKYDQILSWGHTSVQARFHREGGRPGGDTAIVRQVAESVCYMGIQGQVTFPALMTDMNVDPEVQEVRTQTMQLLRNLESALYTSDNSLFPLAFNGYRTRILKESPANNIIDCRGRPLSLDDVDQALAVIKDKPNWGDPTEIHLNYRDLARFNREYAPPLGRFDLTAGGNKAVNIAFDRFTNVVGDVALVGTSFIDAGSRGQVSQYQIGAVSPSNPTVGNVIVGDPDPGTKSYFGDADAGSYYLFAQAINSQGASQMVPVGSGAQNIAAGKVLSCTITASTGPQTDYFTVYATKKNQAPVISGGAIVDANAWEIGSVANPSTSSPTPTPFVFNNFKIPGTTEGYVLDTRMETMFWVEMMSLGKVDLGIQSSSKEFILQLYGAPALRAPGRVALFTNIGS